MEEYKDSEMVEDWGPALRWAEVMSEQVRSINFRPQEIYARFVHEYQRHRKGILQLGGLGISTAGLGFAAGALAFSHRH